MENDRKKLFFCIAIETCIYFAIGGSLIYFGEILFGSLFCIFAVFKIFFVILQIKKRNKQQS
jgi:hypothetical protein